METWGTRARHALRAGCLVLALAWALPSGAEPAQTLDVATLDDVLRRLPPRARPGGPGALEMEPGVVLADWMERPLARPPEPARVAVEYTLDPALDARVRFLLDRGRVTLGHVILLDPRDGRVLAYVSTNPDEFPATGLYPTASLMKVVTAAAVLRHSPRAAERPCVYAGSPYILTSARLHPPRSGGRTDSFWRALAISNNQCFGRMAVNDVGGDHLIEEMERLGMLAAPAPGHPSAHIEPLESDLDVGELGSGLAGSFITPLAAARLAAVLARGELVNPYWIEAVRDEEGRSLALPPPAHPRRVMSAEVAGELRELLVGTTARGTAKSAFRDERRRYRLGDVRVSGKTGSLSGHDPTGRYEWFIGLAPTEAPSLAIAVVVVNPPVWWRNASQIAADVLQDIFCEHGKCRNEAAAELVAARRRLRPAAAVGAGPPGTALP